MAMWSLKVSHGFLFHQHHAATHPVCEAGHDEHAAHIHDERWSVEACLLCAFVVGVPEVFNLCCRLVIHPKAPEEIARIFYTDPVFPALYSDPAMRRGPPIG